MIASSESKVDEQTWGDDFERTNFLDEKFEDQMVEGVQFKKKKMGSEIIILGCFIGQQLGVG